MLLFILLGIVVTVILAILIVKFVPVKLTPIVSLILLACAGYISTLIYNGIMEPIRFHEEKKVRYVAVIKQLKLIADAQDAHNTILGNFAKNGADLISFIDNAKFPITDTRTEITQENRGTTWSPLWVEIEQKVTDTIGYESVKNKIFSGRDYKNMMQIPGTDKEFVIKQTSVLRAKALFASVFEVRIDKADVLEGMNYSLICQEREALGGDDIPGKYISVGSLNEVSVNGNWPPLYDQIAKDE